MFLLHLQLLPLNNYIIENVQYILYNKINFNKLLQMFMKKRKWKKKKPNFQISILKNWSMPTFLLLTPYQTLFVMQLRCHKLDICWLYFAIYSIVYFISRKKNPKTTKTKLLYLKNWVWLFISVRLFFH